MGGGGSLDSMNKTIKNNRALLDRRTIFEKNDNRRYERPSEKRDRYQQKPVDKNILDGIKDKVTNQRRRQLIRGVVILIVASAVVGSIVYEIMNAPPAENRFLRKEDKEVRVFKTIYSPIENGLWLRREYFTRGPKSAETKYKNGKKHQNSESYYQTGEQFRSAAYFYDTLITEVYFYKNGDTIKNFPKISETKIYNIVLAQNDNSKWIEFKFFDGKMLTHSYQEYTTGCRQQ